MERLYSQKYYKYYTHLKQVLHDLDLTEKDYWWLISDIIAYPHKEEFKELLDNNDHLLLRTKDLLSMVEQDDFQWDWAVLSAIPVKYEREDILSFELPYVETVENGKYDPHIDDPKLQHPYSVFELYAVDSSYMFMITEDESLIERFKKRYPRYMTLS